MAKRHWFEEECDDKQRERTRLNKAHSQAERKVETLLRELRHSMPSERDAIRAELDRARNDERQLRDALRALEGWAA